MTLNAEFWAFLCSVVLMVFHSEADQSLPAPSNLTHKWGKDPFVVNVSWSWDKPDGLPDSCKIKYKIEYFRRKTEEVYTTKKSHSTDFLTEELGSGQLEFSVHAQIEETKNCAGWNNSKAESAYITTPKPHAQVVKDFKCSIGSSPTNCSWEPVSPSRDVDITYRLQVEHNHQIHRCHQFYSDGLRDGCSLETDAQDQLFYVLAENEAGWQTFKPKRVVPLPKVSFKEDEDTLHLEWTRRDNLKTCHFIYMVCYSECNQHKHCKEVRNDRTSVTAFDKSCRYEFKFNFTTNPHCPEISSDGVGVAFYGNNTGSRKLSDGALTVVAIVIPVILSIGVILSCYCFRRHRAILCPTMPDPSAIFKEMMNGNKEMKTTSESLYTPVLEPVEHCVITPLTENGVFQQN
ncbi:interleukin-13 receptor subunit alpha-1-like [Stegastes partitus]|uniref:Interleukin-13 receptor subunit alpha-1-like n=1 Tax=Stegastes partitus TaxID=144197 RepID=A0A3B4ZPX0_9TELE|nr:PREDICTED: interleukin-13 receptor subunit alpha-1-like [Stegastes partitus]